jgi:hypothetical protein
MRFGHTRGTSHHPVGETPATPPLAGGELKEKMASDTTGCRTLPIAK